MKVFVTGHRGMLGHVVVRYLSESGWEVVTSEKRYEALPRDPLIEEIRESGCAWVINALGKIKQKCQNRFDLFVANSLFPLQLKSRLQPQQRLIHASTDCVFSGRRGGYKRDAEPDAEDDYGLSKTLGENVACAGRSYVFRTSIIGLERQGNAGLMSWFLNQKEPVNGFANHLWNGVTTLEWAKVALEIIQGRHLDEGTLLQVGVWPPVTKYQLLKMIGNTWNHPIEIRTTEAVESVDRSLVPNLVRPPHVQQLSELKLWVSRGCSS